MAEKTPAMNSEQGNGRPAVSPGALVQAFEGLRDGLLRRLEALEAVALEQAALSGYTPTDREKILSERAASLGASLSRIQAELKRREQEWEEQVESLEHDRKLITEAWKRLEIEQLEGGARTIESARDSPPERTASAAGAPAYRPPTPDESNDPVTKSILKQFQALQGDVRRNAKGRTPR